MLETSHGIHNAPTSDWAEIASVDPVRTLSGWPFFWKSTNRGGLVTTNDPVATAFHRAGQGTPLVLVHGLTNSWRIWRPLLVELEEHHTVFAPTLIGHRGGPTLTSACLGLPEIAAVIAAQMDDQGIERAHIVGSSLGGAVALEVGRLGRALSVLAISPSHGNPAALKTLGPVLRLLPKIMKPPVVDALVGSPMLRRVALSMSMRRADQIAADDFRGLVDDIRACEAIEPVLTAAKQHPTLAHLVPDGYPVRVAWSQHDHEVPYKKNGAPFLDLIDGVDMAMIPGVGHLPMADDPAIVTRTILNWTHAVDARVG